MLIVVVGVSILMFSLVRALPGDPVAAALGEGAAKEQIEKLRIEMGMDRSLPVQYFDYVNGLLHGRFGRSITESRDVGEIVRERLPATLELVLCALGIAVLIGLPLGVISAVKRNKPVD
ncbi:MAG: ABC transporter permease, partial [Comamonadaceae bacterium]